MNIINNTLFDTAVLPLVDTEGEPCLTVIVKGSFTFESGNVETAEEQFPIAYGDVPADEENGGCSRYESDIVPFKPCTDIVLWGQAYAPEGRPTEWVKVGLKVGPVEKQLVVFGDRFWNHAGVLSRKYEKTGAKPFAHRPIVYEDAFGGVDPSTGQYCERNLCGKGFFSKKTKEKPVGKPLPCIEEPRQLIRTIEDHPTPVGFGFYHRAWQPRAAYAGTYDDTWRKNRSPLLPKDFDARYYNGAHPDLQVKGYLRGDEVVGMVNLTPEGETVFTLPGIIPKCSVLRKTKEENEDLQTLKMHLDTLFMEPDEKRFCLVWRGNTPLKDISAEEIRQVEIKS
jgi:hypothetical protein